MKYSLKHRSAEKELIDLGPAYYTQEEYVDCMQKLFRVNQLLGFFKSTRKLLHSFPKTSTLLDVGCGDGLFLMNLSLSFPEMTMQGMDICAQAIEEAQNTLKKWQKKQTAKQVSFQLQQHPTVLLNKNQFDIILVTLVCHHLSDDELINFLHDIYLGANQAVIINDLQRHKTAHKLYAWLSPLLFRNRLITHDGLISIRRGFTRKEWIVFLEKAFITAYQIKWRFPFRWQIILRKP